MDALPKREIFREAIFGVVQMKVRSWFRSYAL